MMKKVFLGGVIAVFFFISCKESSKENIQRNITSTQTQNSGDYHIDTAQSTINWTGYKIQKSMNLNHFGTIQLKDGTLVFKDNQLKSGIVTVNLSTLKNEDIEDSEGNKKLVEHLKGKDFFDAAAYPASTFSIISSKNIDGTSDYNTEIYGTLKLRNISKNISVKANIRTEGSKVFLNTEKFSVNRQDFGIVYVGMKDALISDDFDLQVSLVGNLK